MTQEEKITLQTEDGEFVENDDELDYLYRIFTELMEDMEVEIRK